ncbi:MAG: hypothetical protein KDE27_18470, partial [Planctomycetes bacterium]|nr:hypothetical protein [Planctomycetota bacterium]
MKRTLLVCAFAAALSAGLTAQSPKLTPAAPPTSGFVSLFEDEGTLWALGDDYRARFLSDGVEFTPLLGKLEPETRNLRLRLRATGRASGPAMGNVDRLQPIAAPGRCTWQELGVEVEHGGVREVYEVRSEGLKQSFVFAETPAGTGDLVVRVGLETNMNV